MEEGMGKRDGEKGEAGERGGEGTPLVVLGGDVGKSAGLNSDNIKRYFGWLLALVDNV